MSATTNGSIVDRVRTWPDGRRQEAEQLLADMEQAGTEVYRLSDQERKLVEEGLEEANRGEFVPEAEMDAFWRRHDTRRSSIRGVLSVTWTKPTSAAWSELMHTPAASSPAFERLASAWRDTRVSVHEPKLMA